MRLKEVISNGIVGCKYFPNATLSISDLIVELDKGSPGGKKMAEELNKVKGIIIIWEGSDQTMEKSRQATKAINCCDNILRGTMTSSSL